MIIGAAFADSEGSSNRPLLVSIKHPLVRALQRSFLEPENCAVRGQIFSIAAGEKRPPTPVTPPPEGPGIVECRSLIGQGTGKASSAGDVPCRHAQMAWNGGQWSPYEPMTLPCRRIGWVRLCPTGYLPAGLGKNKPLNLLDQRGTGSGSSWFVGSTLSPVFSVLSLPLVFPLGVLGCCDCSA